MQYEQRRKVLGKTFPEKFLLFASENNDFKIAVLSKYSKLHSINEFHYTENLKRVTSVTQKNLDSKKVAFHNYLLLVVSRETEHTNG